MQTIVKTIFFMIIHNFYVDVMASIVKLFEEHIFQYNPYLYRNNLQKDKSNFIKSYQYNIGDKSRIVSDYKESAKLEFPSCVITLNNNETAFGKEMNLIKNHRIVHVNQIPVTYNHDTKECVMLREEQEVLYFNVQINCESALSAKEVDHQIRRFLPPQKFVQLYKFRTFLELPPYFINEYNNPLKHVITNLYSDLNTTTGESSFLYSVEYQPLIKMDSITSDITDVNDRSFSVMMDFSYLIQQPMWLISTLDDKLIEEIIIGFSPDSTYTGENIEIFLPDNNTQYEDFDIENGSYQNVNNIIIINDKDKYGDDSEKPSNNPISLKKPWLNEQIYINPDDIFIKVIGGGITLDLTKDKDFIIKDDGTIEIIPSFIENWPTNANKVIIKIYILSTKDKYDSFISCRNKWNSEKIYFPKSGKPLVIK